MWIQTWVMVWKWLNGVMTSVTLTFDFFAWTSRLSMVITPENFRVIRWPEHCKKRCDRRKISVLRAAWSQLKKYRGHSSQNSLTFHWLSHIQKFSLTFPWQPWLELWIKTAWCIPPPLSPAVLLLHHSPPPPLSCSTAAPPVLSCSTAAPPPLSCSTGALLLHRCSPAPLLLHRCSPAPLPFSRHRNLVI